MTGVVIETADSYAARSIRNRVAHARDCSAGETNERTDVDFETATLRSAPAIEVAMLRSGRVLQRSKNRFDSPMAPTAPTAIRGSTSASLSGLVAPGTVSS